MSLLLIGFIEMLIVTVWTKTVTKAQVIASSLITFVNVMIWFYVIQSLVQNVSNWHLAFLYGCGCALGTACATSAFKLREGNQVNLP
jgi:hypothetical protein